jgi:hypothetical protein
VLCKCKVPDLPACFPRAACATLLGPAPQLCTPRVCSARPPHPPGVFRMPTFRRLLPSPELAFFKSAQHPSFMFDAHPARICHVLHPRLSDAYAPGDQYSSDFAQTRSLASPAPRHSHPPRPSPHLHTVAKAAQRPAPVLLPWFISPIIHPAPSASISATLRYVPTDFSVTIKTAPTMGTAFDLWYSPHGEEF